MPYLRLIRRHQPGGAAAPGPQIQQYRGTISGPLLDRIDLHIEASAEIRDRVSAASRQFGKRIYREGWKRASSRAAKKVVRGDGAEWIWNVADRHFPGATIAAKTKSWGLSNARRMRYPKFRRQQDARL